MSLEKTIKVLEKEKNDLIQENFALVKSGIETMADLVNLKNNSILKNEIRKLLELYAKDTNYGEKELIEDLEKLSKPAEYN